MGSNADDFVERKADAIERLTAGDCSKLGHRWVKQRGVIGPVCLRCGARPKWPEHVFRKLADDDTPPQ